VDHGPVPDENRDHIPACRTPRVRCSGSRSHPRAEVLYQLTAWAGLWIGLIPLVSYPILLATSSRARAMGRMQALGDWLSAAFAAWSKRHPLPMANSRRQRHT